MIIGHKKIISFFDKVIANRTLAQSYCFVGSEGVGKKTVARYLAAQILKTNEQKLDTHPDFYYLCRQVDEKTEKLKKDIVISQTRDIKKRLGNKPWLGAYQVIVIDEVELLNEESGNALLKLFEEAGGQRVFFLLTADDGALLPTIRSRCQMFYFSSVNAKNIEAGLIKMGYAPALAAEAANLSWGRPGRAIKIANDEQLRQTFNAEKERWQKILGAPFYQKMKAAEDLLNDKADNLRAGEKLSGALENWMVLWREKILKKTETETGKNSELPLPVMIDLINDFQKARLLLAQNINPRLALEQILLKIS